MGLRQLLFLVLGVCVFGVGASVGVISGQQEASSENRDQIVTELLRFAIDAQSFYARPVEENGGGGSFLLLTTTGRGIGELTPSSPNTHADFYIKKSGCSSAVQIVGIGVVPGNNPRLPVRAMITVYADSSSISILN